jgi:stearoyl-CoA desaturase (delta-9 desaturase)
MSVLAEKITMPMRLVRWLLNDSALYDSIGEHERDRIDPLRLGLFISMHLGVLGVLYTGISAVAVIACALLYVSRMFFITGFYHRYFSHRTYKVSRAMQLLIAIAGCTAGQRGPLWWASHHRHHHLASDQADDPHTPNKGMLESHMLWFLKKGNFATRTANVNDLMRFPELRILEAVHWLPFVLLAVSCYYLGMLLDTLYPALGTNGPQLLVWGFFISTILLYHGTYTINSLAHRYGTRRYNTRDDSRNNLWLAILTLGEGWHNNHHRYPASTRQGFLWWEIDISYLLLRLMAMLGLVREMRPVPQAILQEARGQLS